MPSSNSTSDKKRNSNKSSPTLDNQPDLDSVKSAKNPKEPISDANSEGHSEKESEENNRDIVDTAAKQLHDNIGQMLGGDDNDSDEDRQSDTDALTTMNAIMEYNKRLVQKLEALEAKSGGLQKGDIQNSVQDTMHEVYSKYNKKEQSTGTHQSHSFELPVGDMMKGYGAFSTSIIKDKDKKNNDDETSTVKDDDEASTVKDDDDKIRIGDGEKDDIVVKVEATKSGITFSIHIPRN